MPETTEVAGAHVVVVSGRTRADVEALRRCAPQTWWECLSAYSTARPLWAPRLRTWIRDRLPGVRVLALDDDVTDEDMFAALGRADVSVLASVSPGRSSRASLWVDGPAEVRRLLRWMVEARATARALPLGLLKSRRGLANTRSGPDRLLVVSNRTPGAAREGDRVREVGGLVAALEPVLRAKDGIWLGWSGRERDGEPALVVDDIEAPTRALFDFPPAWQSRFYGGLCNRALWPLVHGLIDRVVYEDEDWAAYQEVNAAYARFARQLVGPESTIWIHDYHLLLAARELRVLGHRGPIGLFVHVPFPGRDEFETLPWCREILRGMRSFDLVGFHCERWASNFRACASALEEGIPAVDVFPLGVDADTFAQLWEQPVPSDVASLRARLGARRLLLGVDRLDYSKGIPERLRAYERLLERRPEWRRNVVFVQIAVPSRADVPEYAELRRRVETLVGRINGRFGDTDWVPVRCMFRAYDREALAGLYRAAAVAVVTPLRDGMNLVAKEFVAAQEADDPGVLVLSRFAGAAYELGHSVLTNPFHLDGLAADLDRALRMPVQERRARHESLSRAVRRSSPARWAAAFLARLEDAARSGTGRQTA